MFIINGVQKGWRASISNGYNSQGKLIRKQFYGKTQKEVRQKLDAFKFARNNNTLPTDDKISFEEWFFIWLFDYKQKELKPKSFQRYEGIYRNYIKCSSIGTIKLKDLKATHLQHFYNDLLDIEERDVVTVRGINTRIKPCLEDALKQDYIQKNFAKLVNLPKDDRDREIQILSKEYQLKFTNAIKEHDLELLFLMALGTGLRVGELLGLKWRDINFKTNTLFVKRTLQKVTLINKDNTRESCIIEQEPKTKNSIREVNIPSNIMAKLKNYKVNQDNIKSKNENIYFDKDCVFCNKIGYLIEHKKPNRTLQAILKKIDIKPIKFHALRHTFASRLFESDVPPKTVQVMMGHGDISVTMNIYTHVMPEVKQDASERLNHLF